MILHALVTGILTNFLSHFIRQNKNSILQPMDLPNSDGNMQAARDLASKFKNEGKPREAEILENTISMAESATKELKDIQRWRKLLCNIYK